MKAAIRNIPPDSRELEKGAKITGRPARTLQPGDVRQQGLQPKVSRGGEHHSPTLLWAAALSPMEVIEESKHGIRGRILEEIQKETNFSNEDWSRILQLAARTIQRYRKENALIDSAPSERALLVAQIVAHGREVFGSEEKFKMWLEAPSSALGGMPPKTLLDTTTGMNVVQAELTRIEYGVY